MHWWKLITKPCWSEGLAHYSFGKLQDSAALQLMKLQQAPESVLLQSYRQVSQWQ